MIIDPYRFAKVTTLIPGATGINIGNMTSNGGLAAAFDGTTSQAQAACAVFVGGDGTVGKDYGTAKAITRWAAWGSSDVGFNNQPANGAVTITLEYSDDNSSWTVFDTTSVNAVPGTLDRTVANTTQFHRYWRIKAVEGTSDKRCAEVQFYEDI